MNTYYALFTAPFALLGKKYLLQLQYMANSQSYVSFSLKPESASWIPPIMFKQCLRLYNEA